MSNRKDYLAEAVAFIKSQGVRVIAVHYESDEADAGIELTPVISIQVISPVEFCLNELIFEGGEPVGARSSKVVDLSQIVVLAKEALAGGAGRNN